LSLLTIDEAVPSRVIAIFRVLRAVGPLSEEGLQACLWSAEISGGTEETGSDRGSIRPKGPTMGKKCLEAAKGAGLVKFDGQGYFPGAEGTEASEWQDATRLVLGPHADSNLDLLRPLAWFLLQDPDYSGQTFDAQFKDGLAADIGSENLKLRKIDDFRQFTPWALYLGLVRSFVRFPGREVGYIPDPTRYLDRVLSEVVPDDRWCPLGEFFECLREICPVWPGGRISREVDRRSDGSRTLRWSEATALLRLRDQGKIVLERQADASQYRLLDGAHETVLTSVRRGLA